MASRGIDDLEELKSVLTARVLLLSRLDVLCVFRIWGDIVLLVEENTRNLGIFVKLEVEVWEQLA